MDIREWIEAYDDMVQDIPAPYHYTLGDLIERLEQLPTYMLIQLGEAESYRGCYGDLSFNPLPEDEHRTVHDVLQEARRAEGKSFEGYKGGDFTMLLDTPVWYAHYGDSGKKIMGITNEGIILTEEED